MGLGGLRAIPKAACLLLKHQYRKSSSFGLRHSFVIRHSCFVIHRRKTCTHSHTSKYESRPTREFGAVSSSKSLRCLHGQLPPLSICPSAQSASGPCPRSCPPFRRRD